MKRAVKGDAQATYHRAVALWRGGDAHAAGEFLRDALAHARKKTDAAFLSNVLGSVLASENRADEALAAYDEAERYDPKDATLKLSTARHLLNAMGRPKKALRTLDAVIRQASKSGSSTAHAAHALGGLAHLALNQRSRAVESLKAASVLAARKGVPSGACDLELVEALVSRGLATAECRRYLDDVLRKTEREQNTAVRKKAARLKAQLSGGPET